ncbi:MAG: molybdate ABC transporter permease subunit [Myxococcaceae bacterium]
MSADLSIVGFTALLALVSTLLLVPPGIAIAWWLSRPGQRGVKAIVETLVTLPLVLPPTAVGLLLLEALSTHAPLGRALDSMGIELVFTWKAVVLATFVMSAPLLIRSVRTAFEELDERLLGVARTLGAKPLRVFFRIALPLAWRGVVAGTLLSFCRALGEFGATILIAGNIPGRTQTLALAIFQRAQIGEDGAALRLVAIAVALAFIVVLASELLLRAPARVKRSAR